MNALKVKAILLLSLCALVTACVEPVTMIPLEEMPVVVNCVLTRDSTQYLYLYYAKRLNESEYKSITNAEVIVSGAGHSYDFAWDGARWQCEFVPEYDTEYDLSVTLEDGRSVNATTKFPENMIIKGTGLFEHAYSVSYEKYFSVIGCHDEAFIWLTPTEDYKDSVSYICTNHAGADNSNITAGSWEDLPIFPRIMDHYTESWSSTYKKLWDSYVHSCHGLPLHKDYLRIHHEVNYASGASAPLVWNRNSGVTPLPGGFIIEAGKQIIIGYGDPGTLPLRTYFLSEEYDIYLSNVAKAGLHRDELASMYSMDLNYTNINGGIGIFGSADWKDYVYAF